MNVRIISALATVGAMFLGLGTAPRDASATLLSGGFAVALPERVEAAVQPVHYRHRPYRYRSGYRPRRYRYLYPVGFVFGYFPPAVYVSPGSPFYGGPPRGQAATIVEPGGVAKQGGF